MNWSRTARWVFFAIPASYALGATPTSAVVRLVPAEFATIQAAVDSSSQGDSISVSPGTYEGPGNYNVVVAVGNLTIFAPGGRDFTTIKPTDSADCSGTSNRRAFLVGAGGFTLEGLTIRNGCAANSGFGISSRGGGITFDSTPDPLPPLATSSIKDCAFIDCGSGSFGGAVYVFDSHDVEFESCLFESNYAPLDGGAVFVGAFAAPEISFLNCDFVNNAAENDGGAISLQGRTVTLDGCELASNRSNTSWGAALAAFRYDVGEVPGEFGLFNCFVHSNTANAQTDGAAIHLARNCRLAGDHVTISGNSPHGIVVAVDTEVDMVNTIVYFNASEEIVGLPDNSSLANATFQYSDVRATGTSPGGLPWPVGGIGQGANNINLDPLFCDPASDDYELDPASPCAEAAGNGQNGSYIGATNQTCDTPPVCAVSDLGTDFGEVAVGSSADLTFTIENSGGGILTGTVSESCPDFSVAGNPMYTLSAGQTETFTVTYAPTSPGDQTCPVNLGSSCGTLSFTGTTPPACSVTATSTNFGAVAIGQADSLQFTVENTGGSTLTGTVTESCADFAITSNPAYSLGSGQSQVFTLQFAPAVDGNQTCVVNLGSSCGTLPFTGTTPALCQPDVPTNDFGEVPLGGNATLSFSITNAGGDVLIGTVTESCSDFSIQGVDTYALSEGQSQSFTLRFAPSFPGPQSCTVDLGSTCGPQLFLGTTPPVECTVTAATTDFGPVAVGSSDSLAIEITNTGGSILSGMLTEDCDDFSIVGDPTYSLGAAESKIFTVVFAPGAPGDQACSIELGSSCGSVVLAGTTPAVCDVQYTSLDFGDVFIGDTGLLQFTITNVGGDILTGTVAESCGDFSIVGSPDYNLGEGQSRVFTLEFSPSAPGAQLCPLDLGSGCGTLTFTGATPPPVCEVTAANTDFGAVAVNGSSSLQFSIRNDGGSVLSGSLSETCSDFEIIGDVDYTLTAGQSKTFTLQFAPLAPGSQSCTVDLGTKCGSLTFTGTTPAECAVTADVTDFGEIPLGSTSTLQFTLANVGGSVLTGTVSESCGDFGLLGSPSYALPAGQSRDFTLQFAPSSPGQQMCLVDLGVLCGTIVFTGRTPAADCSVDAPTTDFGPVTVGNSSTLSFTITNSGGSLLAGTVNESCLQFALLDDPTYSLLANESKAFSLTFSPTIVGDQTCTVDLGSGCGSLTFTGTTPAVCDIDVPTADFGEVAIGGVGQLGFTIANTGGDLLVGTVAEGCSEFSVLGGVDYSLSQGESRTFTLQFAPVSAGEQACVVNFGASCGAQTFTGRTPPAVCEVVASETDFGEVDVGSSGALEFVIRNAGDSYLTGTVTETCPNFAFTGNASYDLGADESKTFTLQFQPQSAGDQSCLIDVGSSCGTLTFTGTTPPQCLVTAGSTDFGPVFIGEADSLTFTIANDGGSILSGTVSTICSDFTIVGDASYSLSTGVSKTFTLEFAPSYPGDRTCDVDLGSVCGILQFAGTTPAADCAVDAPTTAFGPVSVGSSATLSFALENTGGDVLSGTVSEDCDDFSFIGPTVYSLSTGESTEFVLLFSPSGVGDQVCTIDLGAASCGTLQLTGTTPAVCIVQPAPTDFGEIELGESATLPVTIRNVGGSVLTGVVTETCGDFTIVGDPAYALAEGQELVLNLRYAPSAPGPQTCELDLGVSCGTVLFTGSTPPPNCTVVATTTDFGAVPEEQTSSLTISLINEGGSILDGVLTESCPDFDVLGDPTYSLGANEEKAFTITFSPSGPGDQSCTLDLGSSCGSRVFTGTTPPACRVAAITDFGEVSLGSTGSLSFDITNDGGSLLAGVVSELCNDFNLVGSGQYSLGPGEKKTFTVQFTPNIPGTQTCAVSLGSECGSLVFSGRTPPSDCSVTVTTNDFQAVRIGETASLQFTLNNTGSDPLAGNVSTACSGDFALAGDGAYNLGSTESKTFSIEFTPSTSATQTCTVDLDAGCGEIEFTGRGVDVPTVQFPTEPPPATLGADAPIVARLDDDGNVVSATIFYQTGGERPLEEAEMSPTGTDLWEGTIPGSAIDREGLRYYVIAVDDEGFSSSPTPWANLDIGVDRFFAQTVPDSLYVLGGISLDAVLGTSPTSLFHSSFGAYDTTTWRYGTHDGTKYLDGDDALAPAPGQGFWIYSERPADIRTDGLITSIAEPFTIDLHPGWNQIANPFQFAIPTDAIAVSDSLCVARDFISWDIASRTYDYDREALEAGLGYWVFNNCDQPQSIRIPVVPPEPEEEQRSKETTAPWDLEPHEPGWSLEIVATAGGLRDHTNFFGMRQRATNARDALDFSDAPSSPGEHLTLSFLAAEGDRLHVDHRAPSAEGAHWTLALHSSMSAEPFEVRFENLDQLPPGWTILAIDDTPMQTRHRVAESGRIVGRLGAVNLVRQWHLVAGTPTYVERTARDLGADFATGLSRFDLAAGPNPFRALDGTVFSLVVPTPARARLDVYNVQGRLVTTLFDERVEAGVHRVSWDGRNAGGAGVAPGIYFARMQSDDFETVRKVVLLR